MSADKLHDPIKGVDKRPHVPVIGYSIGEHFRLIESGDSVNQPDADYKSMVKSLENRKKKQSAKALAPAP